MEPTRRDFFQDRHAEQQSIKIVVEAYKRLMKYEAKWIKISKTDKRTSEKAHQIFKDMKKAQREYDMSYESHYFLFVKGKPDESTQESALKALEHHKHETI